MTITVDGTEVADITIDGDPVQEVTIDGNVVWSATATTLIDSYEDLDYAEYADDEANGGRSAFGFNSALEAVDGTEYAELDSDDTYPKIFSTSGLPNYPEKGSKWQVWQRQSIGSGSASTCHWGWYFGGSSLSDTYYTRINAGNDAVELARKSSTNGDANLASATVSVPTGLYYWIIEWDDGATFGGASGDMNATLYDHLGRTVVSLSANDDEFAGGAFGLWGGIETGEYILWDAADTDTAAYTPYVTLDSFEDSDYAEYDLVASTGDATFVTNHAIDGSQTLRVDSGTAESQFYSSTLSYSKGEGRFLRGFTRTDQLSNTDFRLAFGIDGADSANRFDARVEYFNDAFSLVEKGKIGRAHV